MIGLIGGLFGIIAIVAAALVYLKMGMAKTTIDLYREDNAALRLRMDSIEEERDELRMQVSSCHGKISALEEERSILRDLATGKSAVDGLAHIVETHHGEVMSLLKKITKDRRNTNEEQ